jgi:chromosome segregation ATPase
MEVTMPEKKLEEKITDLMHDIASSRARISHLRSQLEDAESKLIEDKLQLENFKSELRIFHARQLPTGMTERQKEIAEFRERMADTLKKV